jgi:uncharacterized protein YdiU (UPF0061 family)
MATPKQAHALVSYFSKKYEERYGVKPVINRYSARWGFDSILMDMTADETKALIDYYLETVSVNSHNLEWFFYNYDKLLNSKRKRDEDVAEQAVIREATKQRTEEWRKRINGDN